MDVRWFLGLAPWLCLGAALLLDAPLEPSAGGVAAAQRVEVGAAYAWLSELQGRFPARLRGSPAHAGGVSFIASALAAAGAEEVRIEELQAGGRALQNVIGVVRGRSRERIVLAAHHDVVPGAPGAIDDGGAIAALLIATRALVADPPPCDVEVAIFDGEELGCLGAKAHIRSPEARSGLRAALALELVGWKQDSLVVHTIPYGFAWEAPGIAPAWVAHALARSGRAAGVPVRFGDPAVSPWYQATVRVLKLRTGSDAGAYSQAGLPAAMLTGSSLSNFYSAYHRPSDDLSQVDPQRLDQAARVATAAAWELSRGPEVSPPLGEASFSWGERSLGPRGLLVFALLAAAAALAAARASLAAGRRRQGLGAGALGLALILGGACGSLATLLCFAPLASALCLRDPGQRGRRLLLWVAILPLGLEVALVGAASLAFGFGWRGGAAETAALALGVLAVGLSAGDDSGSASSSEEAGEPHAPAPLRALAAEDAEGGAASNLVS